jgi:acetyltransferase-like isoleucine patch superfamily enzyme
MKFIIEWIFKLLIEKIKIDEGFNSFLKSRFEFYYKTESLKCFRIWGDAKRLHVGRNVFINDALINTVSGEVYVEDYVFFGHAVSLLTGTHDHKEKDAKRQTSVPSSGRDIRVCKGAWIGSNATVIGPARIGEYSVVAAGAVLIGDAEAYYLYGGIPAIKIKKITEQYYE